MGETVDFKFYTLADFSKLLCWKKEDVPIWWTAVLSYKTLQFGQAFSL